MDPFNWTCPYCDRDQVVSINNFSDSVDKISNARSVVGQFSVRTTTIVCANHDCRMLTLNYALFRSHPNHSQHVVGEPINSWKLLPESSAKPQPEYITKALRDDYSEACRIVSLSPKASATLARRCLQGMIRDFAGIKKNRLFQEIELLSTAVTKGNAPLGVTAESVEAIDHVRKIGNIGAHMEKDVNLIIEIEPDEAEQLIGLIELLFKEWYVARHDRERRLDALKATAKAKSVAKKPKTKAAAQKT